MAEPTREHLIELLRQARRLRNQGGGNVRVIDLWHQEVDAVLALEPNDEPQERLDDPVRQKHRKFVDSLFQSEFRRGRRI